MQNVIPELHEHPDTSQPWPMLQAVDQLLRDVPAFLRRVQAGQDLAVVARAMILTVVVCAGGFGAAMGAHRAGMQVLYAAVKLPAALLLTTAVCAPALTALNACFRRKASLPRDLALVLGALALTSLVLAAQAPLVLLAVELQASYHAVILLVVACCMLAGAVGISLLARGLALDASPGRWAVGLGLALVFGLVGTQMSWTLRPFLLRPRSPHVVFIRSLEGSFLEAVVTSSRSARGIYWRSSAPVPDEWVEP